MDLNEYQWDLSTADKHNTNFTLYRANDDELLGYNALFWAFVSMYGIFNRRLKKNAPQIKNSNSIIIG